MGSPTKSGMANSRVGGGLGNAVSPVVGWDFGTSNWVPFFRKLFGDEPFRFELGLQRTRNPWFQAISTDAESILEERCHWLDFAEHETLFWVPAANELIPDIQDLFGQGLKDPTVLNYGCSSIRELGCRWPPDFLLMARDPMGTFRFVGGAVCFPSGWAPEEKLGLPLEAIHAPVPTLNQQLAPSIQSFLSRISPNQTFERLNWGIAAVGDRNGHPRRSHPKLTGGFPPESAWLRVEHQSFHSLPRSGGLLFAIHLTVHSLGPLLRDAGIRSGLCRKLATMDPSIAAYKGLADVRDGWISILN